MPNIIDLIAQDSSASDISQEIKDTLYSKAADKIENLRTGVSDTMFNEPEIEDAVELETQVEQEEENNGE